MAANNSSILGKVTKAWLGYKAGKGVIRLVSGPVILSGVGYLLYRKFRPSLGGATV